MNKKIITRVSVAVIPAISLVWVLEWAIKYYLPYGQLQDSCFNAVEVVAALLVLPVRLYAFFVLGDGAHGSWSLLVLISLLAMSCLMWGVIMERMVWIFSKRNHSTMTFA